jgi:hypothetical protein
MINKIFKLKFNNYSILHNQIFYKTKIEKIITINYLQKNNINICLHNQFTQF